MPQYNRRELDVRAREYGFNRDTFEKVIRLKTILEFLNTQEYMREHLLLKGGTAINLTIFNLPRLSVDIDLDFVPNLTREETINERERLTKILKGVITKMADGSIITFRPTTKSDNNPGVDINIEKSTDNGGLKKQKIHFE